MNSRSQTPNNSDTEREAADFRHSRGRRYRDNQLKFFTIAEVADRLGVATRTIRRRVEAGDLVVHRIGGAVRVAESDLRAFLAVCREG